MMKALLRIGLAMAAVVVLTSCSTLRAALRDDNSGKGDSGRHEAPDPAQTEAAAAFFDGLSQNSDLAPGASFAARTLRSYQKANEDLSPQQEYYLGRTFGATILATRPPLNNDAANRYLNLLGQALARFSDRPDTWAGYRFQLIDSAEVNAFAAPGGLIFVTKGLVKLTHNEDELAAVLAHEIGHVEQEHGLKAIRKDRLSSFAVGVGADAVTTFGGAGGQELTAAFKDSVSDLTKTIVNNGYSRDTEFEADAAAVRILKHAGFPPQALLAMLEALKKLPEGNATGFAKSHPKPDDRMARVKKALGKSSSYTLSSTQVDRYQAALGGL